VAIAAITLPTLAGHGLPVALLFLGGFCLAATVGVLIVVTDPAKPRRGDGGPAGSPYRGGALWRIHAASAILVMPQFTVSTFALVFLVDSRHWRAAPAGLLLSVGAEAGAASRLGAGFWSDRVGSRLRPMRLLALAITVALLALAGLAAAGTPLSVALLLAGAVLAVSTNGLAFTAVAELAGPAWAGRALGIQNTGQNLVAAATPPVMAVLIGAAGYPAAFALAGALPLAAAALVPTAAEAARKPPGAGRGGPARLVAGRAAGPGAQAPEDQELLG
jgi:predicted MFS family arabinose efflux permease